MLSSEKTYGQTEERTEGQTEGRTDGRTEGRTDRPYFIGPFRPRPGVLQGRTI